MPLILALVLERQEEFSESEVSLVYIELYSETLSPRRNKRTKK